LSGTAVNFIDWGALARLVRIDLSKRNGRLADVRIRAAANWQDIPLGERGHHASLTGSARHGG
jgi:hypothetical protein